MTTINLTPWGTTVQLGILFKAAQQLEAPEEHGESISGLEAHGWEGHGLSLCQSPAWEADCLCVQSWAHRHWGPGFPHSYKIPRGTHPLRVEV